MQSLIKNIKLYLNKLDKKKKKRNKVYTIFSNKQKNI